jgi:magnesium transporter
MAKIKDGKRRGKPAFTIKKSHKVAHNMGKAPGALLNHLTPVTRKAQLLYTEYTVSGLKSFVEISPTQKLEPFFQKMVQQGSVSWLDVQSTHDGALLAKLGTQFAIHPLVLESIQDPSLRTKVEEYDNFLFIAIYAFREQIEEGNVSIFSSSKISFIIGKTFVITLQDSSLDAFTSVRLRLAKPDTKIHRFGADFLAYSLIDSIVDHYFPVLEALGNEVDTLSERLIQDSDEKLLEPLHMLNQNISFFRKEMSPLNDVALRLRKADSLFINDDVAPYFGNVADHTLKTLEMLNYHRDGVANLFNLYHSFANQRMNHVMKTLTIISTIFIPLTFIAGVYGMNFQHMPELSWRYGYAFTLLFMFSISVFILYVMKSKRWI